ncbi:hypothetical protein [Acinetobacter sp. TSRC1-2]
MTSNEFCSEPLLIQVYEVLAITRAKELNLLAHGQGSPTIQYSEAITP